jgi:hypothetical protein
MTAYIWIILGVVAGAFSLFAVPHGFRLDQQKKASAVGGISIHGDFVSGNKTVIGNQVNINDSTPEHPDLKAKIDVSKLKINRAFQDFNGVFQAISESFPNESESIARKYNFHGMLGGGEFIKAQMDLSINMKRRLDSEYEALRRKIEDTLVETLGKTSLQSAGMEFDAEQSRLNDALSRCKAFYLLLNDNPKSWERKALKQNSLTKDFDVANGPKK